MVKINKTEHRYHNQKHCSHRVHLKLLKMVLNFKLYWSSGNLISVSLLSTFCLIDYYVYLFLYFRGMGWSLGKGAGPQYLVHFPNVCNSLGWADGKAGPSIQVSQLLESTLPSKVYISCLLGWEPEVGFNQSTLVWAAGVLTGIFTPKANCLPLKIFNKINGTPVCKEEIKQTSLSKNI